MCEVRPALTLEALLRTTFALARDGKTNTKGMPNPLRLAVIAERHFAVVRLLFPPAAVQRIGLAVGAALGRVLGYGPCYGTAMLASPSSMTPPQPRSDWRAPHFRSVLKPWPVGREDCAPDLIVRRRPPDP